MEENPLSNQLTMQKANELLFKLNELQQNFFFTNKERRSQLTDVSLKPILERVSQDVAKIMNCQSINIWKFNDNKSALHAVSSYTNGRQPSKGKKLFREDMPNYFKMITDQRTIAVSDISTAYLSKGLQEYFATAEMNTQSMLDASITSYTGTVGVICCSTEYKMHWTPVHHHVLSSVADMLAFVFEQVRKTQSEHYIYELAYKDLVTGLYNQNGFVKTVQERMTSGEVTFGTFICFKIDQYQAIKSVLGFRGAENLLQKVANLIQSFSLQETIVARIAFDYFIVFTPHQAENLFNQVMTNKIVELLKEPIRIENQKVYASFSFGISKYPEDALNVLTGIQTAQIALEHGLKHKTRQAQSMYNYSMKERQKDLLLYESSLRKGLDLNEFILHYQPKIKNSTKQVMGFEALIRWQHPEHGLLMPSKFILIAESTGLIVRIGERVIMEACRQLKLWREKGYADLSISVNLSPSHFLQKDLPEYLHQMIAEYQIEPRQLILEITENIALEGLDNVVRRIRQLKEAGFIISIDDFGTGYASFKYLQDYPVQQIKIDRLFIKKIAYDFKSIEIVRAMIKLNKALGIYIVAEGVETKEQWRILNELGCDEIQGFYFSKPLPVQEAESYLLKKRDCS